MKIYAIFASFLIAILLIVAIGLGLLLVQSSNQVNSLKAEDSTDVNQNEVNDQLPVQDQPDVTVEEKESIRNYTDDSLGFAMNYPESWELSTHLELGASDDIYDTRHRISVFVLTLSKENTVFDTAFWLGPQELHGQAFSEDNVELLSETLFRAKVDDTKWQYWTVSECNAAIGVDDYCGNQAFNMEEGRTFTVRVEPSSEELLKQADQIFLSLF